MSNDAHHAHVTMVSATIHAGGRATMYRRAGVGATVLLLSHHSVNALEQLVWALTRRFRVIVTCADAAPLEFTSWLADFFDGLGLHRAVIVTSAEQSAAVAEFAVLYPDRVRLIVTLGPSTLRDQESDHSAIVHRVFLDESVPDRTRNVIRVIDDRQD